jgi:Putative peptidoglycan binding domain
MRRASLGIMTLSAIVLLAPFVAAQKGTDPDNGVFENLCAPVSDPEFDQQSLISVLNHQQLESVQIELLERGFVPVFSSDPEIDKARLVEVLAQFQAANNISPTGRLDPQTLDVLNVPNPKSDARAFEVKRAKPTK